MWFSGVTQSKIGDIVFLGIGTCGFMTHRCFQVLRQRKGGVFSCLLSICLGKTVPMKYAPHAVDSLLCFEGMGLQRAGGFQPQIRFPPLWRGPTAFVVETHPISLCCFKPIETKETIK